MRVLILIALFIGTSLGCRQLGRKAATEGTEAVGCATKRAESSTAKGTAKAMGRRAVDLVEEGPRIKRFKTSNGTYMTIAASNTHADGTIGDRLTASYLSKSGYRKLTSKISSIHGIDGVYEKGNEIVLAENKAWGAQLRQGQMSPEWIEDKLVKMRAAGGKLGETARRIDACTTEPTCNVHSELFTWALEKNLMTRKKLTAPNAQGFMDGPVMETVADYGGNMLQYWCKAGQYDCI